MDPITRTHRSLILLLAGLFLASTMVPAAAGETADPRTEAEPEFDSATGAANVLGNEVTVDLSDDDLASEGEEDAASEAVDYPVIEGADSELRAKIEGLIDQFNRLGLTLTDLRIYVHATTDGCQGHVGLFNQDYSGSRVDLCTGAAFTIRHELAHAWEHQTMSDETRRAFLDATGLTVWNHAEVPREQRAIELAANIIAWGMDEEPLTEAQTRERAEWIGWFELLTGIASPRLPVSPVAQANPA